MICQCSQTIRKMAMVTKHLDGGTKRLVGHDGNGGLSENAETIHGTLPLLAIDKWETDDLAVE